MHDPLTGLFLPPLLRGRPHPSPSPSLPHGPIPAPWPHPGGRSDPHPEDPGSPRACCSSQNHPECRQMSSLRSSCSGGGNCSSQLFVPAPLPVGSALPHPSLSRELRQRGPAARSLLEFSSGLSKGAWAERTLGKLLPSTPTSASCRTGWG